ncbi:MAG: DUF5701 family protein [Patescibacteria group bacterium]
MTTEEFHDRQMKCVVEAGIVTVNELNVFHGKIPAHKYCILVPRIFPASEFKAVMGKVEYGEKKGDSYLDPQHHSDIIKVPDGPFLAVGIEDGRGRLNTPPSESYKKILAEKRQPYPTLVGIYHILTYSVIFDSHNMDLVGSRYGSDGVPCLYLRGGVPELYASFLDGADPAWGAPSCEEWIVP